MKYVVRTPTEKEYTAVLEYFRSKNLFVMSTPWSAQSYGKDTCLQIDETGVQGYSPADFFKVNTATYGPVIPFNHFAAITGISTTPKPEQIVVGDYMATVNYEQEVVNVGCQTIPFSRVEQLYKLTIKHE